MKAMHGSESDDQKKKPKSEKKKRRRKPRKDIGSRKTSMAEQLSGYVVESEGENQASHTDTATSACEETLVVTSEDEVHDASSYLFPIRKNVYESDHDEGTLSEIPRADFDGEGTKEKMIGQKTFDFSTFLL